MYIFLFGYRIHRPRAEPEPASSQNDIASDIASDVAMDSSVAVTSNLAYYPFDTTGMVLSAEELARIKSYNYEILKPAKKAPNDEEAQRALIQLTQGKLTEFIINENVNIKIGKCYVNPNTEGNFNCVSCMVFIYDRKIKDESVSEARILIKPAYDFYQASENDIWEAKNISLNIPFDHKLFKQYSK
jgi:hypothetical protein